ncbi:MAG: hypothetical protein U9O94_08510 [Nanoarchaeota archaeon]|nr:hypothetical protein [Nanoarchaeota archaeon]
MLKTFKQLVSSLLLRDNTARENFIFIENVIYTNGDIKGRIMMKRRRAGVRNQYKYIDLFGNPANQLMIYVFYKLGSKGIIRSTLCSELDVTYATIHKETSQLLDKGILLSEGEWKVTLRINPEIVPILDTVFGGMEQLRTFVSVKGLEMGRQHHKRRIKVCGQVMNLDKSKYKRKEYFKLR